ncbi:MAG: hypothetical protein R3D67_01235 [Hyphomicrobiaceae bacterium]
MSGSSAYIIAARRSANGRLGGLHRTRRLEDLAGPVLDKTIEDSGLDRSAIDLLTLGNTSAIANPARLVALIAGLGEGVPALTIDRQNCSGLEAIIAGCRAIECGEADAVAAGGAEALSMAPWLIAKPRGLHQTPRFLALGHDDNAIPATSAEAEAANALAAHHALDRRTLDRLAFRSQESAGDANDKRLMAGEIVALRSKTNELYDEFVDGTDLEDLAALPLIAGEGTATAGNLTATADGAAFVIAVSRRLYERLGKPPALAIKARATVAVAPGDGEPASIAAARRLAQNQGFGSLGDIQRVELGEASAAEHHVFQQALSVSQSALNADGGQLARGQPTGAAGAILLVRLFTALVRGKPDYPAGARGLSVIGGSDGQAAAMLVESVSV